MESKIAVANALATECKSLSGRIAQEHQIAAINGMIGYLNNPEGDYFAHYAEARRRENDSSR